MILREPEQAWVELIPAKGDDPAVLVIFAPPTRSMKRRAQRAAWREMSGAKPEELDALELADIGDAFSRELLRLAIVAWKGVGLDGATVGEPAEITPPLDVRVKTSDKPDRPTGTIDLFLADEEAFDAADAAYVLPILERDREKNALSASPTGIGGAGTRGKAIAGSAARPRKKAGAKSARTGKTSLKPPKAKSSGKC